MCEISLILEYDERPIRVNTKNHHFVGISHLISRFFQQVGKRGGRKMGITSLNSHSSGI